jgi:hypothetical protein
VINDVASYGTDGGLYNTEKDTGLSNERIGNDHHQRQLSPPVRANDGIADSWKLTHGLSTTVADSTLLNPLGYTMIEQYAAQIADQYETSDLDRRVGRMEQR